MTMMLNTKVNKNCFYPWASHSQGREKRQREIMAFVTPEEKANEDLRRQTAEAFVRLLHTPKPLASPCVVGHARRCHGFGVCRNAQMLLLLAL